MSYVGAPFAHDLFVSYSHGDDGSGGAYLQPWSAAFARELERELRADRKFRATLSLFLDEDHRPGRGVDPMAPLTEQLRSQIGAAALLLVLMSPDYLASTWCADERDWWLARQSELGLPADERIAAVRIWPTEEAWPAALSDSRGEPLVGFAFHSAEAGVPPRPLGWTDLPGPFGTEFRKALLDLVGRLYPKLEAMKARAGELRRAREEAARLTQDGGQLLYLHGRAEHAEAWEKAGLALTDSGFAVVPGEPDRVENNPVKLQALREQRVEMLGGCDALLLLGTGDGRAVDADLVVIGKHDRQSARARSHRLLPCGLLDTVGAALGTAVRRATARIVQADWIDGTPPDWTPNVRRWLADKGLRAEHSP
jgi:hypothetical protein